MSRLAKPALTLALVVAAIAYVASPYVAMYRIREAAQAKDAATVIRHVDFPALKASLKKELSIRLISEAEKMPAGHPGVAAITRVAMEAGDAMVDRLVTPESIILMLHEKKRAPSSADGQQPDMSRFYKDLDTFVVSVVLDSAMLSPDREYAPEQNPPPQRVHLIFKRHGLFSWKLSAFSFA